MKSMLRIENIFLATIFFLGGLAVFPFIPSFVVTQPLSWICLVFVLSCWALPRWFPLLKKESVIACVQILLCLGVVYWLFGMNLQARWNVIDDHETITFIGQEERLSPQHFVSALATTEVFQFGEYPRYRPSYYVLRLSESFLWGKNPGIWYSARLISLVLALFILWRVLKPHVGLAASGIFLLYLLHYPFWTDVFSRLGPGETYAVAGIAVYAWSCVQLLNAKKGPLFWQSFLWTVMTIAALVCFGVKENLLFLLLPTLVLLVWWKRQKIHVQIPVVLAFVQLAFASLIALSVGLAMRKTGGDIYAQEVNGQAILGLISNVVGITQVKYGLLGIAALAAFASLCFYRPLQATSLQKRLSLCTLAAVSFLMLVGVSQYIFYQGNWPTGMRYDFPGILVFPLSLSVIAQFLHKFTLTTRFSTFLLRNFATGIIVSFALFTSQQNFGWHRERARVNALASQAFTQRVTVFSERYKQNPQTPIVVYSANVEDYEPIFSYYSFLRAYGVTNDFYLLTQYDEGMIADSLSRQLKEKLNTTSDQGDGRFKALRDYSAPDCFALIISGSNILNCQE